MTREDRRITQKNLKEAVEKYVKLQKKFQTTDTSKVTLKEQDEIIKQLDDMRRFITAICVQLQGYEYDVEKAHYIKKD